MNVVFFGTPHFVIPVLTSLIDSFSVVGIVTTPDVPLGRKKVLAPTPVKQFALEHDIPVFSLEEMGDGKWKMENEPVDLFITAAYGKLIPQVILDIPRLGALNIHPSLLPKYRGPSPIQTAILNGDKETGVTIIKMDAKLDHGPILAQEKIPLQGNETFQSLHEQLFQIAADVLSSVVEQWENGIITPTPQDESRVVWCKKVTKENGHFDIENPPPKERLDRMIRAYAPWPTAWTLLRSESFGGQGKILKLLPEKKVQLEGGKPMSMKDFLNGYPHLKQVISSLF